MQNTELQARPTRPLPAHAARRCGHPAQLAAQLTALLAGSLACAALLAPQAVGAPRAGEDVTPDDWAVEAPRAALPGLPSPRQLALQQTELGLLVEYGIATVAGVDRRRTPSPLVFHPDELDVRTWTAAALAAGARMLVLTVREPSGFCLWPSAASNYHVGLTPWRDGRGDLVREVVAACRAAGLAVGFKLSAADLGLGVAATPGRPGERAVLGDRRALHERLMAQLTELCTGYGPLALVWIEEEYDPFGWDALDAETRRPLGSGPGEAIAALVHELQPGATLLGTPFSEARLLVGERGFAPDPLLLLLPPGHDPRLRPDFTGWMAPLAVARARDSKGKLLGARQLLESWHRAVGAGATLFLTLDLDGEGQVNAEAQRALEQLGRELAWRHTPHPARDLILAWGATRHPLLDLGEPLPVDRVLLAEHLALGGQRVRAHVLEAELEGRWQVISRGTTIGARRVHAFPQVTTQRLRVRVTEASDEPVLERMSAYDSQQR
jgi:alpha-L-fucosidase